MGREKHNSALFFFSLFLSPLPEKYLGTYLSLCIFLSIYLLVRGYQMTKWPQCHPQSELHRSGHARASHRRKGGTRRRGNHKGGPLRSQFYMTTMIITMMVILGGKRKWWMKREEERIVKSSSFSYHRNKLAGVSSYLELPEFIFFSFLSFFNLFLCSLLSSWTNDYERRRRTW